MKLSTLFFCIGALFFFSCSSDTDAVEDENESSDIVITSFEPKKLFYKDTLTILGSNFNPNLQNTITINGVDQDIVYFTDNEIQIKAVDGTSSGEIKLINQNTNILMGSVVVSNEQIYRRIYRNNDSELIKINNKTGLEEAFYFDPTCINGSGMSNVVYSPTRDNFIAYSSFYYKGERIDFFEEHNPNTGNCTETNIYNSFGSLVVSSTGRLFGLSGTGIHELNPQNGDEIDFVFSRAGLSGLEYDSYQNELIAHYANDPSYIFYRYNLDTGEVIQVVTQRIFNITTLPSGKLFATGPTGQYGCNGLMEIDRDSGEVLDVLFSVPSQYCPNNSERKLGKMQYLPSVNSMLIEFSFWYGNAQYTPKQILYDFDTKEYKIYDLPNFFHYEYLNLSI